MKTCCLPKEIIELLFSPSLTEAMDWLLKNIETLKKDLSQIQVQVPPKAYSRKVLFEDERGEILLMRWSANTFCSPHDHAKASGFVLFLEGEFIERNYEFRQSLTLRGHRHVLSPGVFPFEVNRIHDMACQQKGLSLHVYTPAISGMKVYDPAGRRTLEVSDSCGAWIPSDPGEIRRIEYWS